MRYLCKYNIYYELCHDDIVRKWERIESWKKEVKTENLILLERLRSAIDDVENRQWTELNIDERRKHLWHNDARLSRLEDFPLRLNKREETFIEDRACGLHDRFGSRR